jgi:hypothetical protein
MVPTLALLVLCVGCGGGGGGGGGDGPQTSSDTVGLELTWSDGGEAIAGYSVHWGTTSRTYAQVLDVGRPASSPDGLVTVVIALEPASTYYFAVTARDTDGQTSPYSNELSVTLP